MSTAGNSGGGRAQALAIAAAVLIVIAAAACVGLPLLHLPAWPAAIVAAIALAPVAVLFSHLRRSAEAASQAQRRADSQRLETDRNQQAIMRLLDEMSSLAEGDLTVQATVTEDITGAIADSVNYAVEALRKLVTTISQSGIQLDGAARQTQALASHLARASSAQSKQVGAATESIGAVASSIEEV
jgi:twitching motility protein PilJ